METDNSKQENFERKEVLRGEIMQPEFDRARGLFLICLLLLLFYKSCPCWGENGEHKKLSKIRNEKGHNWKSLGCYKKRFINSIDHCDFIKMIRFTPSFLKEL